MHRQDAGCSHHASGSWCDGLVVKIGAELAHSILLCVLCYGCLVVAVGIGSAAGCFLSCEPRIVKLHTVHILYCSCISTAVDFPMPLARGGLRAAAIRHDAFTMPQWAPVTRAELDDVEKNHTKTKKKVSMASDEFNEFIDTSFTRCESPRFA